MSAVLVINGTTVNRSATRTTLLSCRPYMKDSYPTLSFARKIGKLTSGPDPWDGQAVTLTQDDTVPAVAILGPEIAAATASATVSGGVVTGVTVTFGGSGYTSAPTVDIVGGGGSGATATATVSGGLVTGVSVTAGGTGYTAAPTVSLAGVQGGTAAAAAATIGGGVVTGITVTDGGSGYTSAPAVAVLGGYGSGATATATVAGGVVTGVTVTAAGSGYVSTAPLLFSGDTGSHLTHYDPRLGWVREWTCYGLAKRAEYIPVTDSLTLTDTARYNLAPDDPDYLPSRAGRTIGQIVADVLEMSQNKAALSAVGVGNYSSSGSGAEATCVISGGAVQSTFTIGSPGSGYSTAPAVLLSGGGGSGATATATVSSGTVTSITRTAAGSGYTSAPIVILSTLPAVTLSDIDGLTILPPFEVDVGGERILQSLEGVVQSCHPNHFVQVDPLGNIRFLDPRTFADDITLIMDGTDPRVGRASITSDWSGCYTACELRGNSLVVPVTLSLQPWPGSSASDGGLQEDFAHDGLTNTQAKAQWRATDFSSPTQSQGTATASGSVTSGVITGISVVLSGYNYASAPTVQITDVTGSGATATASISGGVVTGITVTAGGTGYSSAPTVTLTGPAVGQSDIGSCTMPSTTQVTVTSTNAKANWPANYWDYSPTGHQGVVVLRSDSITDYTQFFTARIIANTALSPGGTSTLTIDSPAPAITYNSYQIYGEAGGASYVYRRYQVTNAEIAAQMTNLFPYPVAYRNSDGTSATLTSSPAGSVFFSPSGSAPYEQSSIGIECDAESGTILTARPTALVFSADGVTPTPVDDFQAFIPVNTGALSVRSPTSGYQGTAFTQLGIERTKVITCLDWKDSSNTSNMTTFSSEYLSTVQDIVYEGTLEYYGLLPIALTFGHTLNIQGNGYVTGWESIAVPIVAGELEYCERGGATQYITTLTFSNRRTPFSGAALQRPAVVGQPLGLAEVGTLGSTMEAASSVIETTGQVSAGIAFNPGAVASSAAQSSMAGMGDPVTGLSSPHDAVGGMAGTLGSDPFGALMGAYQASRQSAEPAGGEGGGGGGGGE